MLETCASICQDVEPAAREGWEELAQLVDGEVVLPAYLQTAYDNLREAGLVSLRLREEYGGFELPGIVNDLVLQMAARASGSLMTIIGLQTGVAEDIQKYASEELCQRFLPPFATGEYQGAMDLTEAQAGSDLGSILMRASEEGDRCFLDGEKIYITNGGAEIHLVLARDDDSFDQSKGTTKGLSLFICPRTLADGTKNGLIVERLEHKIGIHGSPTANLRFDHAEAYRIGKKGEGFKAMLNLMNSARLGVAAQGIGIAEAAVEEAVRYSQERKQFGFAIGDQPLMKNMLARMILDLEGSRALLYRCVALMDGNGAIEAYLKRETNISEAERAELEELHNRNSVCTRLLTPLCKYLATESCDVITRMAVQVHGGIGYMAESTVARLHLDGIITTIYEGTSEIQISFALREIAKGALATVFEELSKELSELSWEPLREYADKVRKGIDSIGKASGALLKDINYALLSSRIVAEMVINVIVGAELLRQADVAHERFDLAASWINRKLLEIDASAKRVSSGGTERIERCEHIISLVQTGS